jgi:hypothetical protein
MMRPTSASTSFGSDFSFRFTTGLCGIGGFFMRGFFLPDFSRAKKERPADAGREEAVLDFL